MISFIVPTKGRETLRRTLDSIVCRPGDEILVVGSPCLFDHPQAVILSCPPGGDWGNTERNLAMTVARNPWLAFIDDDDWYSPDHRELQADAIEHAPGRLTIFSMQYPNGCVLWEERTLRKGNVGTPMLLVPNDPTRLARWPLGVYEGDWGFLEQCRYLHDEISWREEVIAQIGHNVG